MMSGAMIKAFVDSNVLIKYFMGDETAKNIIVPIINHEIDGAINSIVFSEVLYILVRSITKRSANDLKKETRRHNGYL